MSLQITDLEVGYDRSMVLHGISLEVADGTITSVLGANGAGKSTLLRAISGVLRPHRGRVEYDGQRIDQLSPHEIVRHGVVHVPEGRQLFPELTVVENLRLGACPVRGGVEIPKRLALVFEYFRVLATRQSQLAGTLSGGEQQMLALGRALMARPRLLLLDEPSMGLAPRLVQHFFGIIDILNRREGLTMLLVEQNVRLALELASTAYVLENGRVVLRGPAAVLRTEPVIKEFYLGRSQSKR
jgi:branched-chain amino acid transport system ATP-binding protein